MVELIGVIGRGDGDGLSVGVTLFARRKLDPNVVLSCQNVYEVPDCPTNGRESNHPVQSKTGVFCNRVQPIGGMGHSLGMMVQCEVYTGGPVESSG